MKQTSNSCSGARLIPLRYITGGMIGAMEQFSIVPQPLGEVLREYEIPPLPSQRHPSISERILVPTPLPESAMKYSYL